MDSTDRQTRHHPAAAAVARASGPDLPDVIFCGGCCDGCVQDSDYPPATDWSGLVAGLAALLLAAALIGLLA